MLRFVIVLSVVGLVTGNDEVACIDDSDCVVLGHKYACFMYFCHNWVDPSPDNQRCQSDWECGQDHRCYRHWNLRQVDEGVCFPKYQVETCETHSDCKDGDYCCGIHCCSQFYFKQWQQFSCFSDMQCRSWKTGQFCCNNNLCCDDRSSEIQVVANNTLEDEQLSLVEEVNDDDLEIVESNQSIVEVQTKEEEHNVITASTDQQVTEHAVIENDGATVIEDSNLPDQENRATDGSEIGTETIEKASKVLKDITNKAKIALESAVSLANETAETAITAKIYENNVEKGDSQPILDDLNMSEDKIIHDEVSALMPQEQNIEIALDNDHNETSKEVDYGEYHTVVQDTITVNVSSYDLYEEVSDESIVSNEVVTDSLEDQMKNITDESADTDHHDEVDNAIFDGNEYDSEYNITDGPSTQEYGTEHTGEDYIMEEYNSTKYADEEIISDDDDDIYEGESDIIEQEATLNVSLIWKDEEEVREENYIETHESEQAEIETEAIFANTATEKNDDLEAEMEATVIESLQTTVSPINLDNHMEIYQNNESSLPDITDDLHATDMTTESIKEETEDILEIVEEPVLLNVQDDVTESNMDNQNNSDDQISTVYEILVDPPPVQIEKNRDTAPGRKIRYDSESNSFESSEEFSDESTEECFDNGREVFDVTTVNTRRQSKDSYRMDDLDISGLRETGIPDRMVAKLESEDDSEVIGESDRVFKMPKKILPREFSIPSFARRDSAGITLIGSIVLIQLMQNS